MSTLMVPVRRLQEVKQKEQRSKAQAIELCLCELSFRAGLVVAGLGVQVATFR